MRARAAVLAALAWAACAPPDVSPERGVVEGGASASGAAPAAVRPSESGPARFGFGRAADEARIARQDIDVGPDGVGLPPGRGTAAEGAAVYRAHCVACHGPTGSEGPFDVLVGGEPWGEGDPPRPRTVGNYWPWATTLFDYVRRAMPQHAPGTLTADETYAVVAWLLARNGIIAEAAVMDAATLPAVVMPVRDRFVTDDRRGGPEVR